MTLMNKIWRSVPFFLCLAIFSSVLLAQDQPLKLSPDEAKLAKKLQDVKTMDEKMKVLGEIMKKFPKTTGRKQYAKYLAGQIQNIKEKSDRAPYLETFLTHFTNQDEKDFIVPMQIEGHVAITNYGDAFKLAEDYVTRFPDDVSIRTYLATEGGYISQQGVTTYDTQAGNFAKKAIELIEANKRPADIDEAAWKDYQTRFLAQLYQSLGIFNYGSKKLKDAATYFDKSTQINPADVNTWALLSFVANDEYQTTAKQVSIASGKEKEDLYKKAEGQLDKVIELFARIVAMTDGDTARAALNSQFRQDLEGYYKFRNNKSTAGMQQLIDKYKKKN